ncbi:polysaccharide deacetylase family protein [Bacillus aquiflavi]|nr:polysaccharide deacetylase family protein [Bacillus aquiflavi]UAC49813.1 polysaccharide deacetylase family protein [Bacillus aquiflavi]
MDKKIKVEQDDELRDFGPLKENEKAEKVPVLMYHRIIADEDLTSVHRDENGKIYDTIVTVNQFKEQMKFLHDNNFTTLTLKEFEAFMDKKLDVPEKSVYITFDDGFKDNYANAYPVLNEYGFKATIFLITGNIDKKPRDYDPSDAQYLSHEDITKGSNVFNYASHTHKFHEKDENNEAFLVSKDKKSITKDLEKSIKIIGDNTAFAYPFGAYDDETLDILKQQGVKIAFTVIDKGMAHPSDDFLQIPRRGIYPSTTIDIFKNLVTYD